MLPLASLVALIASGCGDSAAPQDLSAIVQDLAVSQDLSKPRDLASVDAGILTCPTGTIPPSTNTLYAGDTTAGLNLITDARIEWGSDPDHALLYVAPTAGTFRVSVTSSNSPTTNDCGVILRDYGSSGSGALYDESACPTGATPRVLDGAYATTPGSAPYDVDLAASQHLLMWVSCSMFATPQRTISYVVHVALQ